MSKCHLSFPTTVSFVLGLYILHTNSSSILKTGIFIVPNWPIASNIKIVDWWKSVQYVYFPLLAKRLFASDPVKIWKFGRIIAAIQQFVVCHQFSNKYMHPLRLKEYFPKRESTHLCLDRKHAQCIQICWHEHERMNMLVRLFTFNWSPVAVVRTPTCVSPCLTLSRTLVDKY